MAATSTASSVIPRWAARRRVCGTGGPRHSSAGLQTPRNH
jgi:hypothetical protein